MPQDNESKTVQVTGLPPVSANIGSTWVDDVPGLREKRKEAATPFVGFSGIEEMLERGLVDVEPQGDRLLLRAVLTADAIKGGLVAPKEQDSRRLACMQVVAVGPACAKWWDENGYSESQRPKVGDFVWILVTVADRLAVKDNTVRLMTAKAEYVAARIVLKNPPA